MRPTIRYAIAATILAGALPLGPTATIPAFAQGQESDAPKQVALTQAQIDNLVASQKDVRAAEGNGQKEDPQADAKMTAAVKKHGFDSLAQFGDVSYSVGVVMSGIDPESKTYVGTAEVIKKQIQDVKGDAKMSAKDKKDALAELEATLKQAGSEKPMPGNIDLVKANFDKLAAATQQSD